ncbi:MAG: 30S ribosomal protein S8 [Candidatus Portnoybacteria bacterium CG10_big_fil_rev_8_21_14_0_10_44_7]|uniref:Small ribosomal subunit protein uS8 n=1 Tax=Candidatus Portnoybacteria bacterium CG10_big_fil_rev_8_21_14_0_10_44_7 TaxID=1974816 RepID=A0A2M8KIJ8_9BACT|nr:MAG: 30S ribosomal protein S8 [Candidatus Portnoybacteria bacterium CG10_big_fil_rev_8_21_14_0_10_44_7]
MDNIANMLTQIRNAQAVGHQTVAVPFSRIKIELAKILQKNGFLAAVKTSEATSKKMLLLDLKYNQNKPAIAGLKRISTPGCRRYSSYQDLRPVKQGHGLAVLSTPRGLLTDREAKKQKVGGEILCEIW